MALDAGAAILVALVSAGAPPSSPAAKPKLVVLALEAAGGVEPQLASVLTEAVTAEVAARGFFEVVSTREIQTLLGVERQRRLAGCSEEGSSCLTELAGALGARFVLSGSLAKLGDAFQLNLQTLDSTRAQTLGRTTMIGNDLAFLRSQVPYAVAEATATPLPPLPSRVLPFSLIGAGGLLAVAGGVVGLQAVAQDAALQRELTAAEQNPSALRPREVYREEIETAVRPGKTLGLLGLVAGSALVATGLYLMPSEPGRRTALALVPSAHGVTVVGTVW